MRKAEKVDHSCKSVNTQYFVRIIPSFGLENIIYNFAPVILGFVEKIGKKKFLSIDTPKNAWNSEISIFIRSDPRCPRIYRHANAPSHDHETPQFRSFRSRDRRAGIIHVGNYVTATKIAEIFGRKHATGETRLNKKAQG